MLHHGEFCESLRRVDQDQTGGTEAVVEMKARRGFGKMRRRLQLHEMTFATLRFFFGPVSCNLGMLLLRVRAVVCMQSQKIILITCAVYPSFNANLNIS